MRIYRLIVVLLLPFIIAKLAIRMLVGPETRADISERLGFPDVAGAPHSAIWLHGASLGELTSAREILHNMLKQYDKLNIVVTCNTVTARAMVQGWKHTRLHARLAPLDNAASLRRFLNTWQPRIAVTLENEIWPNRIMFCAKRNVPFMVLAGRMSPQSAKLWRRFPGLARQVMGAITALAPLNVENGARFQQLGVPVENITEPVNLKSGVKLPPPDPQEMAKFAKVFTQENTLLAASTHPGEDEIILTAFGKLRPNWPDLCLILVPRHPHRAAQITSLLQHAGLGYNKRADDVEFDLSHPVYLADTIGEMPLWYSLSCITILGGSFRQFGGHTPVEAVQFGSVVVHGPDTSNHRDLYQVLHNQNAAFCATDQDALADIIAELLQNKRTAKIARSAKNALSDFQPDNPGPTSILRQLDKVSGGKLNQALLFEEN